MSDHPWHIASDEVQLASVTAALEKVRGNVTNAAGELHIDRSHLRRLMHKFDLGKFAAELRIKAGGARAADGRVTGRPRKKNRKIYAL
jgi:Bacterial regulatory protein, Fis family